MLLIDIDGAKVGDIIAAPVKLNGIEIVKPGMSITQSLIINLKNLGIKQLHIASLDIEFKKLSKHNVRQTKAYDNLVKFALSYNNKMNVYEDIINSFDSSLMHHSMNVSMIASMIISDYKLPLFMRRNILSGAILHDIGKLDIDPAILNKPGKLTKEEFEIIKQHTTFGYDSAKQLHMPRTVKDVIVQHHENYNGTGYPYNLSKDEISLGAMVVHIADVYEARCSKRVYKDANARKDIKDDMRTQVGTMFSPEVFEHFDKNVPLYFKGETVLIDETEYLVVGYSNDKSPVFQNTENGDVFTHDELVSSVKHIFVVDSIHIK